MKGLLAYDNPASAVFYRFFKGDYFQMIPKHAQECAIEVSGKGNGAQVRLAQRNLKDCQYWRMVHFDAEGFW